MSRFEFLMMIAAVVVAVGMTEIVGGWGRLMRTRAIVRTDWLHLAWTIMILFSLIQYWIGMWAYHDVPIERTYQIFFLIIPSLLGVLSSFAITPDVPLVGELDIREYYWAKRSSIFLPLAGYVVAALLADLVIIGVDDIGLSDTILFTLGAATTGSLIFFKRVWFHWIVLSAWVAILVRSLFT